jgi:methylated-DNA-protein-cysteine methyltransferase-like protein
LTTQKLTHSVERDQSILRTVAAIPAGRVCSYGAVAARAGHPGAARLVGRLLSQLPAESSLPWQRVVNAQGRISLPDDSPGFREQVQRLRSEGVEVTGGRVDLRRYGWPA